MRLGERALVVARANLGYGEQGANNRGRFVEAIGGAQGAPWCAAFAGYCYRRAYWLEGSEPGSWLFRRPSVPETGARALVKAMGRAGRLFKDPSEARPGDLVCWARGLGWSGHVGVVELVDADGLVHTIEGNVGAYPSKVRRLVHDVSKERLLYFATLS